MPIAGLLVNIYWLVLAGLVSGVFSGLFGIGGGFIITSCLIFLGVSPTAAVSSSANQIIASSTSGFLFYNSQKLFDLKLAILMSIGGALGSITGIILFHYLASIDLINSFIAISYIIFFGTNSLLIFKESLFSIINKERGEVKFSKLKDFGYKSRILPFHTKFKYIHQEISIIIPLSAGFCAGTLTAMMGVGGGFILVPIMIYILRVPTKIAIGTSLFQIIISSSIVTFLQAANHNSVDIILVLYMSIGAVCGSYIGNKLNSLINPVYLRLSLSIILMMTTLKTISYILNKSNNSLAIDSLKSHLISGKFNYITYLLLEFSRKFPYCYGLLCVAVAINIGLIAYFIITKVVKFLNISPKKINN